MASRKRNWADPGFRPDYVAPPSEQAGDLDCRLFHLFVNLPVTLLKTGRHHLLWIVGSRLFFGRLGGVQRQLR